MLPILRVKLMLCSRKFRFFYRIDISADSGLYAALALHKVAHKAGCLAWKYAQHIVHHQHLTIAVHTRTYAYGRAID